MLSVIELINVIVRSVIDYKLINIYTTIIKQLYDISLILVNGKFLICVVLQIESVFVIADVSSIILYD